MGLFGKKKETPEEKTARLTSEAEEKKTYDEEFHKAKMEAIKKRAATEGEKAGLTPKKKGGLLNTIGAIAEGSLYGMNKGAEAFNKGVGLQDFNLKMPNNDNETSILPKGKNDLFFDSDEPKRRKRRVRRKTD
jgi:hypothetical protein